MSFDQFSEKDYWRALILYGKNQATYKLALGQSLLEFAKEERLKINMRDLAEKFFDLYLKRVEDGKPQLYMSGRKTAVERAIDKYRVGRHSRFEAINNIRRNAFNDVIPRFHNLSDFSLPFNFYEEEDDGIVLHDELLKLADRGDSDKLLQEVVSRWDMLEGAFLINRDNFELRNNLREFYLEKGHERTNLTKHTSLLNGYQDDICFYCAEKMNPDRIHVDHVIPRAMLQHDEVWNLVLSHKMCNMDKLDAVPPKTYIRKLFDRNEHFIASDHPIKHKLIKQMGSSRKKRREFIKKRYEDAKTVIGRTWDEFRRYNPDNDPFYKSLIRKLNL